MPMLFSISGHSASVGGCKRYLEEGSKNTRGGIAEYVEKGGRAAAQAYIGIERPDQWAREMDEMRRVYGQNKGVTFRHFILSPDPRDKADAEDVAAYAREWTVDRFGENVQAAITVHTDTSNPHAHIVVNNLDLSTGKKIHISKADSAMLAVRAQQIGVKYGYRPLPDVRGCAGCERSSSERGLEMEWRIESKGYVSWKSDIRRASAAALSKRPRSFAEYRDAMRRCGFDVRVTRRGGYTYRSCSGQRCKGEKLGTKYEPVALVPIFKDNAAASAASLGVAERMSEALRQIDRNGPRDAAYRSARAMEERARGVEALLHQGTASRPILCARLAAVQKELATVSRATLEKMEDGRAIEAAIGERRSYSELGSRLAEAARIAGEMAPRQRAEIMDGLRADIQRFEELDRAYAARPDLAEERLLSLKEQNGLEIELMESKNIDLLDQQSEIESAIKELDRQTAAWDNGTTAEELPSSVDRSVGRAVDDFGSAWIGRRESILRSAAAHGVKIEDALIESVKRSRDAVHVDNVQDIEQGKLDSLQMSIDTEREV